jgi:hypothetical protein
MTDEHMTAYLLEELSEEESERFEEQCFAQDEWPAELDAAEQDLIDAYLRHELTADRRRHFEERYLTTDARKARVLIAKSLHEALCPARQKPTWRESLQAFWQRPLVPQTAIAILVLTIGISLIVPWILSRRSPQTFTAIELATSSSDRASGVDPTIVSLPLNADALQVHLKLPKPSTDTSGYRVQWEDANGPLRELKIEPKDAQTVVVNIPATELKPGRYLLRLSDNNGGVGNFYFTAVEAARTR